MKYCRPISLLSIAGKIFERLLYNNVFEFFTENYQNIIEISQNINQPLSITREVYKSFDDSFASLTLIYLFETFLAAHVFQWIKYSILSYVLDKVGFPPDNLHWPAFLSNHVTKGKLFIFLDYEIEWHFTAKSSSLRAFIKLKADTNFLTFCWF